MSEWLQNKLNQKKLGEAVTAQMDQIAQQTLSALREQGRREIAEARETGSAAFIWRTMREYHATGLEGDPDPQVTISRLKTMEFKHEKES